MGNENYSTDSGNSPDRWAVFEDPAETSGFSIIPNVVMRDGTFTMQARYLYGLLKSYAWQDASTYPGMERLCRDAGVSKDTLGKYLHELVDRGLVHIKRRGQGRTNLYTFKALTQGSDRDTGSGQDRDTGSGYEYTETKKPPKGGSGDPQRNVAKDLMIATAERLREAGHDFPSNGMKQGHISSWRGLLRRGIPEAELHKAMTRIINRKVESGRLLTPKQAYEDQNGKTEAPKQPEIRVDEAGRRWQGKYRVL